MGIGNRISLTVLVVTVLVLGIGSIAIQPVMGWLEQLGTPWTQIVIAVVGGLSVAGLCWASIGLGFDKDAYRLNRYLESLMHPDSGKPTPMPNMWLGGVGRQARRVFETVQKQKDKLVSQRRELEIQCRVIEVERQHAEAIIQSISDAVLVTDAFNEIALANESAADALNFELDDSRHRPVDQVVKDPGLIRLIRDTRESGNLANRRRIEHEMGENGQPQVYNVTLACVGNAQDEVSGVVTILHDITKEKQISEMKSDFVSSVSHELRTPLSSIKAYVEMLVDGEAQDEETRTEFYNIIQSESNRLSRLIDNILNISRIESGIVKVQREYISLPAIIHEVADIMQPQARAKQITLTEEDSPLYYQVYADKDMICQALINLIGNAIKYTPNGGQVTIDSVVDEHAKSVAVNIHDSGVGIPPEALPHLFDKFYRVTNHKNMAKGTGLGLNLVKQIVETVHGGKVSVSSEVGKGSTFGFSLPLSEGAS